MPTSAHPNTESSNDSVWEVGKHIPQLDGVRGLAILIVTLYRFSKEMPTEPLVGKILHAILALGERGVDLFFVLSGFLITGILVDTKGRPRYFKNFFARRSLRIFPLYFGSLFLFLILFPWLVPTREFFSEAVANQFYLWTYLTNVKMSIANEWCFGALDHFWSLAVEEHFYLVWPLVIFLVSTQRALWIALGLAILSASWRTLAATSEQYQVAVDVLTLFRCDSLLIGAALALQIRLAGGIQKLLVPSLIVFTLCGIIGVLSVLFDKRLLTISHTIWALIWASVLVWLLNATERHWIARFFRLPWLQKLGKFSYGMYVFQSPLIPLVATVVSVSALADLVGDAILGNVIYIAIMFALSFGAALLSWYVLEVHCLKLKDRFSAAATKKIR